MLTPIVSAPVTDVLAAKLLPEIKGKQILIVGHQHNIPHLLNQLKGGGFAFEHISGYDYGRFFVAITQGIGATEVLELRY